MSTFELPRDVSRRARLVLFAAFTVIDDEGLVHPEGEPPSSMTTLRTLTGHQEASVHLALKELVETGIVETWVERKALRVKVLLAALKVTGACAECGSPARGTGRWCAHCKQVLGRDDRAWQIRALELFDAGFSPHRIAVVLKKPMWKAAVDDGRDPNGGAVVPFLLGKRRLGGEWAERLREALSGALEDA